MGSLIASYNGKTIINDNDSNKYTLSTTGKYMSTDVVFTGDNVKELIVSYNGYKILSANGSGTWTLKTNGKYMKTDVSVSSAIGYEPGVDWFDSGFEFNGTLRCVTYGNGMFVACSAKNIIYSTDGKTWENASISGSDYIGWEDITYGDGTFVAIGYNSAAYSKDGKTWEAVTIAPITYSLYSVAYGDGMFVAVGHGYYTYRSVDGKTWTRDGRLPEDLYWLDITYGDDNNPYFVAVAQATEHLAYSGDGIYWTTSNMPSSSTWRDVTYGYGRFLSVGNSGAAYTSSVYNSPWKSSSLSSGSWESVIYGGDKFVCVGQGGPGIRYSEDGITWNPASGASFGNLYSVTYGKGTFVAVGSDVSGNGVIVFSNSEGP